MCVDQCYFIVRSRPRSSNPILTIKLTCWWLNLHINVFPRLFSLFFIFVILVDRIPQEYVLPHHLYDIFLVIIHPSQFTYRQKSEQAHFPASRLFTREAGNVRREVVWDIFEQNTSNHFSVHAGGVKREVGSGKREALWSPSLKRSTIISPNQSQTHGI